MYKFLRRFKNLYHKIAGYVAAFYYGLPSGKLKIICITGTDGKTTTVNLIYQALINAGEKAIVISSVYAKIGDLEYDTGLHTTTPSSVKNQFFLKKAVEKNCRYAVLEVTAHGIDQNRIAGIRCDIAGITNITPEHIISKDGKSDYFQDFQNYRDTKIKLLQQAKTAIINKDDENFSYVKGKLSKKRLYTYSIKTQADFQLDFGKINLDSLPDFLKEDYTLAYAVLKLLEIDEKIIIKTFKSFKLPAGRIEVIWDKGVRVIIDFAHTQNSFKKVLPFIKNKYAKNSRLIHVFGTAGERDFTKRSLMGRYSAENADVIILTEEDYRNEDIWTIFSEIEKGIKKRNFTKKNLEKDNLKSLQSLRKIYLCIPEREKAIKAAVEISKPGDVILLTGKSHEKSLARGSREYPWDEKKTAIKYLKKYYAEKKER